jgi:hypothetical protein
MSSKMIHVLENHQHELDKHSCEGPQAPPYLFGDGTMPILVP